MLTKSEEKIHLVFAVSMCFTSSDLRICWFKSSFSHGFSSISSSVKGKVVLNSTLQGLLYRAVGQDHCFTDTFGIDASLPMEHSDQCKLLIWNSVIRRMELLGELRANLGERITQGICPESFLMPSRCDRSMFSKFTYCTETAGPSMLRILLWVVKFP